MKLLRSFFVLKSLGSICNVIGLKNLHEKAQLPTSMKTTPRLISKYFIFNLSLFPYLGLSALLSSQHFSTVPLATPKSNLRTLKYLTWNTVTSFVVITLAYITLGFCLEFGVFSYTSETVPFFSCYVNVTTSNAFFCSDIIEEKYAIIFVLTPSAFLSIQDN